MFQILCIVSVLAASRRTHCFQYRRGARALVDGDTRLRVSPTEESDFTAIYAEDRTNVQILEASGKRPTFVRIKCDTGTGWIRRQYLTPTRCLPRPRLPTSPAGYMEQEIELDCSPFDGFFGLTAEEIHSQVTGVFNCEDCDGTGNYSDDFAWVVSEPRRDATYRQILGSVFTWSQTGARAEYMCTRCKGNGKIQYIRPSSDAEWQRPHMHAIEERKARQANTMQVFELMKEAGFLPLDHWPIVEDALLSVRGKDSRFDGQAAMYEILTLDPSLEELRELSDIFYRRDNEVPGFGPYSSGLRYVAQELKEIADAREKIN